MVFARIGILVGFARRPL